MSMNSESMEAQRDEYFRNVLEQTRLIMSDQDWVGDPYYSRYMNEGWGHELLEFDELYVHETIAMGFTITEEFIENGNLCL